MYSITVGITSLATDFILVKTVLDCFRFDVLHVPVHKTSILNVILLNPYKFLHASKKGKEVGAAPSEFNFLYVHLVHIHL